MPLHRIVPGPAAPSEVNVVIEIPSHGDPVKYEVDKDTGAMVVDRFMGTAMHYPCNYGYVPGTLAEDGDPVDVLVVTPCPLISGAVIRCRPVGMLAMTDEKGPDAKVLAVPCDDLTDLYRDVAEFRDLAPALRNQVAHFFEHYKDLEAGKWVRLDGWRGAEEAREEIRASLERYRSAPEQPAY